MECKFMLPIRCEKCKCLIGYTKHNIETIASANFVSSIKNDWTQETFVMLCEKCVDKERTEQK